MLMTRDTMNTSKVQTQRAGEFFNKLSPAAQRDLESMEFPTLYQPGMLLFSEEVYAARDLHRGFGRSEALNQLK